MKLEFKGHTYELPKLPQYEDIEYASCLCCPDCQSRNDYNWMDEMHTDRVVGFIENKLGEYEIVLECKFCHKKYRFHLYKRWDENFEYDREYWKAHISYFLFVHNHTEVEVVTIKND